MDNDDALLQMVSDVREDIRLGFSRMNDKLDDHIQATNEKFEMIHIQQAEDKGAAEQRAKLWGIAGGGISAVFAGSYELLKHLLSR